MLRKGRTGALDGQDLSGLDRDQIDAPEQIPAESNRGHGLVGWMNCSTFPTRYPRSRSHDCVLCDGVIFPINV